MALFDSIRLGSSQATGFEVKKSLMLNDQRQTDFKRTPAAQGDRRTLTMSFWAKHVDAANSENSNEDHYFYNANRGSNNPQTYLAWKNNSLAFEAVTGGSYEASVRTEARFRDPSAWTHYVFWLATNESTASNRVRFFINGDEETNKTGNNVSLQYPSQGFQTSFGTDEAEQVMFEYFGGGGSHNYDGYIAEFHYIDAANVAPTEFAEYDDNGNWVPKEYTGSYGSSDVGFYLKFTDNSNTTATTMGKDYSGNGNNWTPSNFVVSDISPDTPTNNFCVMNINDKSDSTQMKIQYGGRRALATHGFRSVRGTFGVTSGKWYWEARLETWEHSFIGITNAEEFINGGTTQAANTEQTAMIRQNNGNIRTSGSTNVSYGTSQADGDILGFALDMDNGKFYISKNGTFFNSGDPVNQTNPAKSGLFKRIHPCAAPYDNKSCYYNFGADDTFNGAITSQGNTDSNGVGKFKYAPPTGFLALCSKNLPEPTVPEGKKYFDILLYTGNGGSQSITGLDFQPDWLWLKSRSAESDQTFCDAVRGRAKLFYPSSTQQENTSGTNNDVVSFDSNGFSLGAHDHTQSTNANGVTIVAWCWDTGTQTVTNNDGSISSQVRANPTAGVSVVSYTGTGSNATVGHGLGVTPVAYFVKRRDNGSGATNWRVYHQNLDNGEDPEEFHLRLNSSDGQSGQSNIWNDTKPTSTTISIGTHASTGSSGGSYMAYVFAPVEGFSAFGGYTGNSSSNGTYINCGFRPAYIIVKKENGGEHWQQRDTKREPFNVTDIRLEADERNAEGGQTNGDRLDILSNGFKARDSAGQFNDGHRYVYFAWAEHPFKTSRGR